jgi:hypothetical protein
LEIVDGSTMLMNSSERSVSRDIIPGEAFGESLNRINGTSLDKGVEQGADAAATGENLGRQL